MSGDLSTFPIEPIQEFVDANSFPDFGSSSFPLFALGPVSYSVLKDISATINEQSRAELGFSPKEYDELGPAIDIPEKRDLNDKSLDDAVHHHFSLFNPYEKLPTGDPKWYPVGFVAVLKKYWRDKGLLLTYLQKEDGYLALKSCVVKTDELGGQLVSFRQGDAEFDYARGFIEA